LRRSSDALRRGSLEWLKNSDESRVVTFLRRTANDEVLVAINFSNHPFVGSVEGVGGVAFLDVTPDVGKPLPPDAPAPERAARKRSVELPVLSLDAWGYRFYRRAKN
jgi:glycosidase